VKSRFPDPRSAPPHGLLATGGDLSLPLLLDAYAHGIFPWYNEHEQPQWWSPDPRAILDPDSLHVSRSLARLLRLGRFTITWNTCFERIMRSCGEDRAEGSWIFNEMVEAYVRAHRAGHAHSVEVWRGGELAGGLYGVQIGAAFMAESMFHRVTDASKVALVEAVRTLFQAGIRLFDVQFLTPHLVRMGAYQIRRDEYLRRLAAARIVQLDLCPLLVSIS
jgi:leucyl/phenylalanyl-tRNA--protein transferase